MYDYEDEDDDELFPLDLPDTEQTVSYLVSQFFIEADRREKRVNKEVSRLLDKLYEKHGEDEVSISLMNYISTKMGWDIEILMEKYEVEDYLLGSHNIFDENIWRKVLGTSAMSDYRREVFALSQTYLTRAVREVLEREQPNTSPKVDPLL
jgi:hypothetical protein